MCCYWLVSADHSYDLYAVSLTKNTWMTANSFERVPVLYKSVSGFALRSIRLGACCSLVDWRCCFCRLYWWIRGVDGHLVTNANFCVEELQTVYIIRFTSSQDIRYLDCRMYQLDSISYLGAQIRQDTRFFTYPSASEQDGYIWYPCAIGCRVHHVYKLALPVYFTCKWPAEYLLVKLRCLAVATTSHTLCSSWLWAGWWWKRKRGARTYGLVSPWWLWASVCLFQPTCRPRAMD